MRKTAILIVFVILALSAFVSCEPVDKTPETEPEKATLNVDFIVDDQIVCTEIFTAEEIVFPAEPVKDGFVFTGWILDENESLFDKNVAKKMISETEETIEIVARARFEAEYDSLTIAYKNATVPPEELVECLNESFPDFHFTADTAAQTIKIASTKRAVPFLDNKGGLRILDDDGELLFDAKGKVEKVTVCTNEYDEVCFKVFFTEAGGEEFAQMTRDRLWKIVQIYIGEELFMCPSVNEVITSGFIIFSGVFGETYATGWAIPLYLYAYVEEIVVPDDYMAPEDDLYA